MTTGHPVDWDFDTLVLFESELDGEVGVGSNMQDQVISSDDEDTVDEDEVMAEGVASS